MIWEIIVSLGIWNWIILGLALLAVEVLAPGTFVLWLGMAAIATGLLTFVTGIGWQAQLMAFAVLSVLAVVGWWFYAQRPRTGAPEQVLHRRADLHIDRVFTLDEPIVQGMGRVHIDDSIWRISGPDLPAGAQIRVEATDGALLKVVAA